MVIIGYWEHNYPCEQGKVIGVGVHIHVYLVLLYIYDTCVMELYIGCGGRTGVLMVLMRALGKYLWLDY